MKAPDILSLLQRKDKHFLGGGNRLLWAPLFPQFLNSPGFWDAAQYFNAALQPVFTWTLLDDEGRELPLTFQDRVWEPSSITQTYTAQLGAATLKVDEEKAVLEDDVMVCQVKVSGQLRRKSRIHFVAWTVQEHQPGREANWLSNIRMEEGVIRFRKHTRDGRLQSLSWETLLAVNPAVRSYAITLSEPTAMQPLWRLTPFVELFHQRRLPDTIALGETDGEGIVYMALHAELTLGGSRPLTIVAALAAAPGPEVARANIWPVLQSGGPVEASRIRWRHYFRTVPHFECSDEHLTRYYWYRWYGLHLNTINVREGNYRHPFVCEGVGYFRAPISYSAVCHILENRWLSDPTLARGSFLTFLDNSRPDGAFRGYIDPHGYRQEMFYHADWGNALMQLHAIHPSVEFLTEAYQGLAAYARFFDHERDDEASGLYDIHNHYETGQEYMHRYVAVSPKADTEHWGEVFRLKGVDVTVYLYRLKRALAFAARLLGKGTEADLWNMEADRTRTAVQSLMWDPEQEMFFDIDPARGARTGVKAATCFYPYFTDIVTEEHLPGLKRHLLNAAEFWTPYPVPSSSMDDPYFSAFAAWKGKRMNCPWNGRVWPMTNSHIAEALTSSALRFGDQDLRRAAVEFVTRFVRTLFFDGNPALPNCFEHYNPITGTPSMYRGVDDYQHSWVADLILKYVCGIRPEPDGTLVVDPLPFDLQEASLTGLHIRGKQIDLTISGRSFRVTMNGADAVSGKIGRPVVLHL